MRTVTIIIGLSIIQLFAAISFIKQPAMTFNAGSSNWTITFEISQNTDVEVSIVNVNDSSVVRHLAAGLLGANPPAPLTANNLAQTLVWDGKDDFGAAVTNAESLSVRVRAGMSARLSDLAGEDLYSFQGNARSTPSMLLDKDGSVFILGKAADNTFLRKYDAAGNYVKTIFPPAAGLATDSVVAYGINVLPEGGWAPKTVSVVGRTITSSILNNSSTRMLNLNDKGEILLVNGWDLQTIRKDGSFTNNKVKKIITSPAAPAKNGPFGPQYFTPSHNPKYLYLSGMFYGTWDMGCWLATADTSGFWGDGQVFRVDVETGVVTSWLKLDSVPVTAAARNTAIGWGVNAIATIHGVVTDESGNVFVCDRLHKRIGVYDTSAQFKGSIPCVNPDYVAISKRTGAVYVITRGPGMLSLNKYDGWQNVTTSSAKTILTSKVDGFSGAPIMTVTESGTTTSIYVGYGSIGFRLYQDNGNSFYLVRDFSSNTNSALRFERIAVNRKTDAVMWEKEVYQTGGLNFIKNWQNPISLPVNTTNRSPLQIANPTYAPNGYLYGRPRSEAYLAPICRYKGDSLIAPAPYSNTNKNNAGADIGYEGTNHRGIAFGWQGQLASFDEAYHLWMFRDTGNTDTGITMMTTNGVGLGVRQYVNGVRFDPAGNFYIGVMMRPTNAMVIPGFSNDNAYTKRSGSVIKFSAGTIGTVNASPLSVTGAALIYPQPFGPFAGDNSSICNCRNSYFDVDPYGRIIIPNASTSQIYISDNAGNNILTFGGYGNTDSRGPLSGPGETVSEPAIAFAWPTSVGSSEDYIYVADAVNARIVRVKMAFAIDNIAGLTDHPSSTDKSIRNPKLSMTSSPNPFNPASRITVQLPTQSEIRLDVYTITGKYVKSIAAGSMTAGNYTFVWKGVDDRNLNVTAGIYLYRLTAGNRTLTLRTVLAK